VSSSEYVYLAVALVVLLLAGGSALFVGRRRRPLPPGRGEPHRPTPGVDRAPGVGDDAEVAGDTATGTLEHLELPGEPVLIEEPPSAATAPAVERPEPVEGRLVRLRARLARSNTALGKGLLALLSRDTLDESTWDEVEETLLVADVGVGPIAPESLEQRLSSPRQPLRATYTPAWRRPTP
jgi:fused signal recognition particle receptor